MAVDPFGAPLGSSCLDTPVEGKPFRGQFQVQNQKDFDRCHWTTMCSKEVSTIIRSVAVENRRCNYPKKPALQGANWNVIVGQFKSK